MKNKTKQILFGCSVAIIIGLSQANVIHAEEKTSANTIPPSTITIPSEVSINDSTLKGTFSVESILSPQNKVDISISSKTENNLVNGDCSIPYTLDKTSFSQDNKTNSFSSHNEKYNISVSKESDVSGDFKDVLTFNITYTPYKQYLDLNGYFNGKKYLDLDKYATADVYINGVLEASNVSEFHKEYPFGSNYEIKLNPNSGFHTTGMYSGSLKGTITDSYLEITPEFASNKYSITYDSNGGTGSMDVDTVTFGGSYITKENKFTKDKSIFIGWNTKSDGTGTWWNIPKWENGFYVPNAAGTNGIYESNNNAMWAIADNTTLYAQWAPDKCHIDLDSYLDGSANYGVHYYGTVDIYVNGELVADDVSDFYMDANYGDSWEIRDFKAKKGYSCGNVFYQNFNYASIPTGFISGSSGIICGHLNLFPEWNKAPVTTGTVLNIEGSDYIVMGQTEDGNYRLISGTSIGNIQFQPNVDANGNYKVGTYEIPDEKRPDGQNSNTYEGSYIDNYLENTWYKQLPDKLQKAIQTTDIKQASYKDFASNPKWKYFDPNGGSNTDWYYNEGTTENPKWVIYYKANFQEDAQGAHPLNCWKYSEKGYNNTTYNTISRHVFLPNVEEVSNLVDLNNANKVYDFLKGTNNSLCHMWFRDSNSSSPRIATHLGYGDRSMGSDYVTKPWIGVRPSFVIDLSKIDYTVTGSVNYK